MADPAVPVSHTADSAGAVPSDVEVTAAATPAPDVITDEVLVEEVSIDGMCGVY
jgi:mycofactocin precursor